MLTSLTTAWETLRETYHETRRETGRETSSSVVSTSAVSSSVTSLPVSVEILGEPSGDDLAFGVDALYVMLAIDDAAAPAQAALASIHAVLGNDPQARAFANLWHLVGSVASGLERLPASQRVQPRYALSVAWNATGLAPVWQRAALFNTAEGRTANDRLDAAMRLFQFADDSTASRDITSFMAQVRGMEVQADSLAHIGPVEDAVTLTTPAGAAGRHWEYAWIPVVQQDVWPNLAGRNTMFGGEDLAELVLRGALEESDKTGHDPRFAAVLSGEKKSFLVALTRARRIMISAVWNDSMSPSDFLFGYLPEYYPRNRQQAPFTTVGHMRDSPNMIWPDWTRPTWLVSAARAVLATAQPQQAAAKDAAIALTLLLEHGVRAANPQSWALWNRRPNRIARHLAVRHLAVRHLAIPHLTVPHPTARHLVVYSLTVSKQGKARRMCRPRPWSPYLHRRSTAYGRARCAGCWRTGSPVLAPAPWPPVSEPSSMRLRSKAARKAGPSFPQCPGVGRTGLGLHGRRGTSHRGCLGTA